MPEGAVTTSADGYMLAIVFTREDGDQREEPELYVWDLRPMVRQLAWESRRNFLHFLYGHKFQRLLCGSMGITNADASNVNITTVFSSISLTAESAGFDHPGPSACCQVFYNAALIKIITLYLI